MPNGTGNFRNFQISKERTTLRGEPKFSKLISGKFLFHLILNRNFRKFWSNGMHPRIHVGVLEVLTSLIEFLHKTHHFLFVSLYIAVFWYSNPILPIGLPKQSLVIYFHLPATHSQYIWIVGLEGSVISQCIYIYIISALYKSVTIIIPIVKIWIIIISTMRLAWRYGKLWKV